MHRVFPILVLFAAAIFAATMFVGFFADPRPLPVNRLMDVHFLSELVTSLVVLFVNGIVVTYFIGTSRWCREVVDAYRLPAELAQRSHELKRRTFPFSLGNMLFIVGLMALGAAAHTRVAPPPGMTWADLHLLGAFLFLAFMALATYVQWMNIRANQEIIARVVEAVRAARAAKGLD